MKNIIKIKHTLLVLIAVMISFVACDDKDDYGTPERLFRPVIKETSYSGTWIRAEWDRYEGAKSFNLELSTDSFATILRSVETDTIFYLFEDLEYDTDYQLRIQAVGSGITSKFFVNETIKTSDYPTKLTTPSSADVIDKKARIRWEDDSYDSLVVFVDNEWFSKVDVSPADNEKGQIVISSLEPETNYVVRAYSEGNYMGKKQFRTSVEEVFEGNIVDLRDLDSEESYTKINADYISELEALYPEGVTVVLAGGVTYEIKSTIKFTTPFRFITGLSLDGFAKMQISANFDVLGDAQISKLYFQKIVFTDHPDKPRTDGHYGGTYLFNFDGGGARVGELLFDNCDIRYKRGVVRAKAGATIERFIMHNCFVDSIGGYGIFNLDHDASFADDIIIKNSTFAYCEKFIAARKTPHINSILLENITVYKVPNGTGDYYMDLENKTVPGGVTVKNSIFGPSIGATSHGIRFSKEVNVDVTVDKSYSTSDQAWTPNAETGMPANPIDLEKLSKSSAEIFANPAELDFTIIDASLKNKAGDPRWW